VEKTQLQYKKVIDQCLQLFLRKAKDYGTSWRILRLTSVTDLIFIKAERIKSIEETKVNKVGDSIKDEFIGIINYCVIALILMKIKSKAIDSSKLNELESIKEAYMLQTDYTFEIMTRKNHDYGEAWRQMRPTSFTDLIRMKLLRLKQIEDNDGKTIASEGPIGSYVDIINYAVFALIRLEESIILT